MSARRATAMVGICGIQHLRRCESECGGRAIAHESA
jgi:hypothetical protein